MGVAGQRIARTVGLLVVVPAICGGVLAAALLAVGSVVEVGSSSARSARATTRPTVPVSQPIAIPVHACPYLETVQASSLAAHRATVARSSAPLGVLQLALRLAATPVPEPLRLELEHSADFAEELRAAAGPGAPFPSLESLTSGIEAVDHANHLVGTACGFQPPTRPMIEWP